ncbi:uncharacterized protein BJ171DRAFT_458782 [Polychytrium aggregatum]|uniref:uncharacterized protein n=1 Tax=Polychytrium aggregatum TaxID=110093 RepID=UPI0022FEBC29|nr:uncharacterized protein BJ171DRAFT_458782 [Polychytrium aggregatum]KAI9205104.1 hypothetical protein BJ171DRAFT_458782 [Polychytrium aggregatum]
MEGIGSVGIWGFSKSIDLQDRDSINEEHVYQSINDGRSGRDDELHRDGSHDILLIGSIDSRHLMKTISRAHRHEPTKLNFFVMEPHVCQLARHMALLLLFLDHSNDLGLQERCELFMDIYGNTMMREKSADWVKLKTPEMIRAVTDGTGFLASIFTFNHLRFRERDDLEFVFKFWQDPKRKYEASKLWEYRVRRHLGIRFDHRENAFDWDYHMKIPESGKSVLSKHEYLKWRSHGIGFEIRESSHEHSNRTMATVDGMKEDGLTVSKWGYFSDIVMGPYVAFGLDSENKDLIKTKNGVFTKTATDVTEFNIKGMMYELETNAEYKEGQPMLLSDPDAKMYRAQDHVQIHFLPCDFGYLLKKKQKFVRKFRSIFLGALMAHRLPHLAELMDTDGLLIVENAQFVLDLNSDQKEEYERRVAGMATEAGLEQTQVSGGISHHFVFKRRAAGAQSPPENVVSVQAGVVEATAGLEQLSTNSLADQEVLELSSTSTS